MRPTVVQIDLARTVAAQPAVAFATVANLTDWPQIIESVKSVELLTPGPIRAGTRLREDRVTFGRDIMQEMQVATIERPHRLRRCSSSIPICTMSSIT